MAGSHKDPRADAVPRRLVTSLRTGTPRSRGLGVLPALVLFGLLGAATAVLELTRSPLGPVLVPACLALGSGAAGVVAERGAGRLPGRYARPWRASTAAECIWAAASAPAAASGRSPLPFPLSPSPPHVLTYALSPPSPGH